MRPVVEWWISSLARFMFFTSFKIKLCLQGYETVCVSQLIVSYHWSARFCPKYGDKNFLSYVGNIVSDYDINTLLFFQCFLEKYLRVGYCIRSSRAWYLPFYLARGSQMTFAKTSELLCYELKSKVTNWISVRWRTHYNVSINVNVSKTLYFIFIVLRSLRPWKLSFWGPET